MNSACLFNSILSTLHFLSIQKTASDPEAVFSAIIHYSLFIANVSLFTA